MTIAISGSLATDHLMTFAGKFSEQLLPDNLQKISVSFLVNDLVVHKGGVGGNIAFALGVLGSSPLLIGAVGDDFAEYNEWLEKHGVDTSGISVFDTEHTARFTCTTDQVMAQISSFYPGAMSHARTISLIDLYKKHNFSIVLIGPNDPAAMLRHTNEARDNKIPFVADPSQQLSFLDGKDALELVHDAHYLLSNDYEWELLQSKTGKTQAQLDELVKIRITTLGEDGVTIIADRKRLTIPAVSEKAKEDPTGVGDAFRGGFLAGIDRGLSLERSAQLGQALAVEVLETSGPQNWVWNKTESLARLKEAYGEEAANEISTVL